jgi:hypothetical protein
VDGEGQSVGFGVFVGGWMGVAWIMLL